MIETIDTETGEVIVSEIDLEGSQIAPPTHRSRNVFQRILDVMADLPGIAKRGIVDFGKTKYDYQKMEDMVSALHPLQVKHGIVIVPDVQKSTKEGNLTMLTLLITVINADDPDDRFTSASLGYGTDSGDKGAAKAYTAALKSFYSRTFALAAEVEPDADNQSDRSTSISAQDLATLHDIIDAAAESSTLATAAEIQAELCEKAGIAALLELPTDGFKRAQSFVARKYSAGRKG